MPSPEQVEYATVLLRRAESDLRACETLANDAAMNDDVIGFHAQQAVEKSLKVALVLAGVEFPRTHDLSFLVDLASEHGVEVEPAVVAATHLTPWAAQLRYDDPSGVLDREAAVAGARAAVAWARTAVAA